MKTEGLRFLTFLEAVKALNDGKCKAIGFKTESGNLVSYRQRDDGVIVNYDRPDYGIRLQPKDYLRNDWVLIDFITTPSVGEVWKKGEEVYLVGKSRFTRDIVFYDIWGKEYKSINGKPISEIQDGKDGWKRVWRQGKEKKE